MKAKTIIAAAAVLAATAGSAFADTTYPTVTFVGHQSTVTRAQVQAELKQAQADGNYIVGGNEYVDPAANFVSTKTRAQVLAELHQAQQDGTYVAGGESDVHQFTTVPAASTRVAER